MCSNVRVLWPTFETSALTPTVSAAVARDWLKTIQLRTEKVKKRKAKWVPSGPCQGTPLRKHAVCNGVGARGLFGERKREGKSERDKGLVGVGTWERQAGRQTDRQTEQRQEEEERQER